MLTAFVDRLPAKTLWISSTQGNGFALAGRKSWKFWQFFAFFGPETPIYSRISVKFGKAERTCTHSALPNFTLIRELCRPCGAKNSKSPAE